MLDQYSLTMVNNRALIGHRRLLVLAWIALVGFSGCGSQGRMSESAVMLPPPAQASGPVASTSGSPSASASGSPAATTGRVPVGASDDADVGTMPARFKLPAGEGKADSWTTLAVCPDQDRYQTLSQRVASKLGHVSGEEAGHSGGAVIFVDDLSALAFLDEVRKIARSCPAFKQDGQRSAVTELDARYQDSVAVATAIDDQVPFGSLASYVRAGSAVIFYQSGSYYDELPRPGGDRFAEAITEIDQMAAGLK